MLRLRNLAKITGLASVMLVSNSMCSTSNKEYPFIEVEQYNANNPIQDRFCFTKLTSIGGYTVSVFDGHGGDLVSEYASKNLNGCIDHRIKQNKNLKLSTEQLIEKSLIQAYKDVEDGFFAIFKDNLTSKAYQRVGSCALTAVILKNSLHVANAGDCEGVLLSANEAAMTNLRLNAGESFEQARLVKEFPGEPDIFVCGGACYVKGRLQPTRSFGDFYLKFKQYNFTKLKVFTGPYISAVPLVTHFPLTNQHKNVVLASDGLWDQMDAKVIHGIFRKGAANLAKNIFNKAIEIILERNSLKSFQNLNKIAYRRDIHDDITVINVDLQNLRKTI